MSAEVRTPRAVGQVARAQVDTLADVFGRVRSSLRESRGLDLDRPLTELEREGWRREFSLAMLIHAGQLFDPAAGLCLATGELSRWRRRRSLELLMNAVELCMLHGVTAEMVLRDVGAFEKRSASPVGWDPASEPGGVSVSSLTRACPDCQDGQVKAPGRFLGEFPTTIPCQTCSGTGTIPEASGSG
jgi:hypothetical protein